MLALSAILRDYIQSDEWHDSIEVFIDSNCDLFSKTTINTEFTLDQHNTWKVQLYTTHKLFVSSFITKY